jgi:hypothetical protein
VQTERHRATGGHAVFEMPPIKQRAMTQTLIGGMSVFEV